jgi:5-(carboxyamino)imidazole ribonucleotide synthase
VTSQFENHIRAVLGLPLGSTEMRFPAAVTVNLLGERDGAAREDITRALAVPGAHLHLYSKREVRRGRKMGHITALGATLSEAEAIAQEAAALVTI